MTEAARARAAPLHPGLPDEIFIWEVLLRLPPKDLLRCRAVCRAWRHATSTRDFLLAHHGHQPSLPLLYEHNNSPSIDIIPLDHRATSDKLHSVARLGFCETCISINTQASCDGLLIFSTKSDSCFSAPMHFSVCNPATRQYAPLPLLCGFCLAGMYPHHPTGEYRLLLYPDATLTDDDRPPGNQDACYLYTLGSCQPPRHIGWPEVELEIHGIVPALFRGSLHWHIERDDFESNMIMVFDTTTSCSGRCMLRLFLALLICLRWMECSAWPALVMEPLMCGRHKTMTVRSGHSNTGLNYRLQSSQCSLDSANAIRMWWFRLGMTMCSFWSNLAGGYFRSTSLASWSQVSIANYYLLLNFVSNKHLFNIPSFRQ